METNEARDRLTDVERLRGATIGESYGAPRWAFPVLGAAIIAFFTVCAFAPDATVTWASLAWTGFVVAWVIAIRRTNRARAAFAPSWRDSRPYVLIAFGVAIASTVAVAVAGDRAWVAVGLAFAIWGATSGIRMSRKHA